MPKLSSPSCLPARCYYYINLFACFLVSQSVNQHTTGLYTKLPILFHSVFMKQCFFFEVSLFKRDVLDIDSFCTILIKHRLNLIVDVVLKTLNKNNVNVEVFDNENIPFSKTAQTYKIKETAKGGYQLTLKDIPSAIIEINNENNFQYYHPNIEIDGKIYTLKISATKQ